VGVQSAEEDGRMGNPDSDCGGQGSVWVRRTAGDFEARAMPRGR
jgi:hypothetical protein